MRKRVLATFSIILGLAMMTACGASDEATTEAATTAAAVTESTTEATEATEAAEDTEAADDTEAAEDTAAEDTEAADANGEFTYGEYTYTGDDNIIFAISDYMCNEIAPNYSEGDVAIPFLREVGRDDSNPDDIKVWGDFDIMIYNLEGDTLVSQAGGNHPGCMHVKTTDAGCGYVVTSFDQVADGADYDESAKEIFGDKYEDFTKISSDDAGRTAAREDSLAEYVTSHQVPATKYQDYGWDPVDIPLN